MIIEQIWTGNNWRNYNYIIACPENGEALVIDPSDHEKCLDLATKRGWEITQVLNTHEHGDHTGGNEAVIAATGAKLLAHTNARDEIAGVNVALEAGDAIKIGASVELETLDTPGHTMSHVCLLSRGDTPALFCGDTLFNAGAGNCQHGGHPDELYRTFTNQLALLPDNTLIYPGHDYFVTNLQFTLDREPGNKRAGELLQEITDQDPGDPLITSIGLEKDINTFFRLGNPEIIEKLREARPDLPADPDERTVFTALRELRNSW